LPPASLSAFPYFKSGNFFLSLCYSLLDEAGDSEINMDSQRKAGFAEHFADTIDSRCL